MGLKPERRPVIAKKKQTTPERTKVNLRSSEMREIAHSLALLGLARVRQGEPLNVRRREKVRRALGAAGENLGWADVAAISDDPIETAAEDLKKIVRSGVRSLQRQLEDEVKEKKSEVKRLEKVVAKVQDLADDPEVEYPTDIVFARTAKSHNDGLITKTETITVGDPKEALKAAQDIEAALPKWTNLREQMLEELKQRRDALSHLSGSISEVIESWRGLLRDVLVTMA